MKGGVHVYLTIKVPIYPTYEESLILEEYAKIFHSEIEVLVAKYQSKGGTVYIPYKNVSSRISFYSKCEVIKFANMTYDRRAKNFRFQYNRMFSLMAKSFSISESEIEFVFGVYFKVHKLKVKMKINEQQKKRITSCEVVKLDLTNEENGYFVRIIVSTNVPSTTDMVNRKVMGVDLGMKCPAVCYTSEGKIKFIGNGRENKYHLRKITTHFKRLVKLKNNQKPAKFHHHLRNYKINTDHVVSKAIVDFAYLESVGIIKLENLSHLQKKFTKHDQISWSYQRLQTFIEYKAKLVGIKVVYINPEFTSKKCPKCGKLNNVKGRSYKCKCGFKNHRDVVGAMNILLATKV